MVEREGETEREKGSFDSIYSPVDNLCAKKGSVFQEVI